MKQKVALAFSGGLDTSFCVPWLIHEKGLEVHTVTVNTGGFSQQEADALEARQAAGCNDAHQHQRRGRVLRERDQVPYLRQCVKKQHLPPFGQLRALLSGDGGIRSREEAGADFVAHGSTGAGNDQVRFDLVFEVLVPDVKILAPIRSLSLSRQQEIDYLKEKGFDFSWEKSKYSINQGLWGTSVGGVETLKSSGVLPEEAYPSQVTAHGSERHDRL